MPHNPTKSVQPVNFLTDYCNYWGHTLLTYKGLPFRVSGITSKSPRVSPQDYSDIVVSGLVLESPKSDWKELTVGAEELVYDFPKLGYVHTADGWVFLHRMSQRKMIKGYCPSTVGYRHVSQRPRNKLTVMSDSVIRQIFFGNTDRINPSCVIDPERNVWYEMEKVATIQEDGSIEVVENHEKMGAYVCKLLANSSVARNLVPNLQVNV